MIEEEQKKGNTIKEVNQAVEKKRGIRGVSNSKYFSQTVFQN